MTKKRYSLSLNQKRVDEFQTVAKAIGMPASIMSTICDEAIAKSLEIFKRVQATGTFSFGDLMSRVNDEVVAAHNEEISSLQKEVSNDQKGKISKVSKAGVKSTSKK